ncbi:MAG: ABC transporter permease [Eubacteriaceae bacterium]|nr:ABC transporter permease [Eubacteriaceae bacterium]
MEAWRLISTFDSEIYGIIGLSLIVTLSSTVLSALLAVPLGVLIGSNNFKGKNIIVRTINTLMGLPPVVAGLIVYLLLSRTGPLGYFGLLFSPGAMVIAQVCIVTPIIAGLTMASIRLKIKPVKETCQGMGLSKGKTTRLLLHECRYPIISAVMAGYGRAISEVGAIMLVGGNIQFKTRVMTTAIVLETGKGNYGKALALGIILLVISFAINWLIHSVQEGKSYEGRSVKG